MKFCFDPPTGDELGGTNCAAGVTFFEMEHVPNPFQPRSFFEGQTPIDNVLGNNSIAEQSDCEINECNQSIEKELKCPICNPANTKKYQIKLKWANRRMAQLKMLS